MNRSANTLHTLLLAALLAGCASTGKNDEEVILPQMQKNTYLSHAKPPQQFGFSAYSVPDGGIAFSGSARLHPNHLSSVKFEKGSVPVIRVRGKAPRHKMNLLLDTASQDSWLEFNASQEFGATFLGTGGKAIPYRGAINTGLVDAYAAVLGQIRIDDLFMENIPFYVRMAMNSLGPLARGIAVPKVEGVFGYDALGTFEYIQFNIAEETVSFSSTIPYMPHENLVMTRARIVPMRNHGLAVEGAIYGDPMPILLDFAGDYHFARGDVTVNSTKMVSLGDLVYRNVPTLLLPPNSSPPRAGRKMLEQYIVTICNREGIVYFERLPEK